MKYNGIKNVNSSFNKSITVKRKSLHFFAFIVICILLCASYNVSLINAFGIKEFIVTITSNWTPKPDDFGKIKFVNFSFNNNNSADGIFMVSSPFKNYYVSNISDTLLEVNGLGDIVVISPIDGVVQSVGYKGEKCNLALVCDNVVVNLQNIDYACVNTGQKVSVGEKIAVSLNSQISFSIICNGEYINLPASGAGDTFFEWYSQQLKLLGNENNV